MAAAGRVVLHLDMDAFYAAVEIRDDPALAGKPVIVGHPGRRGVVTTCSYEARAFGVRSAMPSITAARLCPRAVWVPVRMEVYAAVSRRIHRLLRSVTPVVEPVSIDEAFLDVTTVPHPAGGGRLVTTLEDGRAVGARLKEAIRAAEGLTASAGVAPNKFLAKVASDLEKPDGLVVLPREAVEARLWPLPAGRLWGVGPRTAARLEEAGIATIGDLARAAPGRAERLLGRNLAAHLLALARGDDGRPVDPGREARSISEERTYRDDLVDADVIDRALLARAEGVARSLRRERLAGRTVRLKVRAGDFTTWTRARTLSAPTDLAETIVRAARDLLGSGIPLRGRGIRLLGVGVSGLEDAAAPQGSLFVDRLEDRIRRAARAADTVRDRLGDAALVRARLLAPPGVRGTASSRRAGRSAGSSSGARSRPPRRGSGS